ncbi:Pol [Symbiodinium natans]|uniref:Pol protein n=1 Tax=Symbiodinium natans TaxID=878477 RepID=A0A812JQJ6_9DINO|nr:Pol [Symbiodinium natans]
MRKTGRRLRKAWRLTKLQEAEEASQKGRMHDLYAVVRQLAPKQVRRKVRLRGEDGALLDHHGEMQLLQDHCCTLFSSATADGQEYDLTGLAKHVTEESLLANMKRLPLRKVAPPGHVPAVAWKMTGRLGCQAIEALVHQLTSVVPKPWKDAWLAFIPKIATPKVPRDLRPIGLQDIDGKCVLGAVRDAVMPFIMKYVEAWPQFAYVGQRSTRQAINRALCHCDFVRSSLQGGKLSLYDRRKGCVPARSVLGGIQVSVDMSQAFDRLDRTLLQAAMCDAHIPSELQAAIMAWHQDMEYHLRHADLQGSVDSTVGVRQGCNIAPILWVLYTCYFFRTASDFLPQEWLQSSCTFFADDLHFCDVIAQAADLDSFLQKAGKLFLHLQKFNMLINYKKSAVLMHLKGACTKRWRKHHVFHREGGSFLRIRVGETIAFLPIKTTHKYLGIILSYQAYEKATVLHRLEQSKAAYHRLRPVLTSKSTLNQQERLRVWQVCVLSCLRYGLDSIPLRQGLLKLIQVQCARQIRAITRSPVHLSKESTARLYDRLRIPTELTHLRGIQAKQLPEAQHRQVQRGSFCLEQMDWLLKVTAAYEQLQEPLPPNASTVPDSASASTAALIPLPLAVRGQACPVCGLYFKDVTGVKIHMTRKHPASQVVTRPLYEQSRCGVDGMPTCAACRRPFSSWGALKQHVLGGHCRLPLLEQTPSDNLSLRQHPLVIATVRAQGWQGLLDLRLVRERVLHFCPLCNQWCVNASGVKVHLQDVHPQWHDLQPRIKQIEMEAFFGSFRQGTAPMEDSENPFKRRRETEEEESRAWSSQKPKGKGKGKGRGKNGGRREQAKDRWTLPEDNSWRGHYEKDLMTQMARLILRHEDQLSLQRQDSVLHLWLRNTGEESIVGMLWEVSKKWKKMRDTTPAQLQASLRATMMAGMLKALKDRLHQVSTDEKLLENAKKVQLLDAQGHWVYQVWDHELEKLQVDASRTPLKTEEIHQLLAVCEKANESPVLYRFHAKAEYSFSEFVHFEIEVGHRGQEAADLYRSLKVLCQCSVLQIIGARLRKDKPGRSATAQRIQDYLR